MSRAQRTARFAAIPLVWGMVVGLLVGPFEAVHAGAADGEVEELRLLETVEVLLEPDGVPDRATLHSRLDARGHGSVEITDPVLSPDVRTRSWWQRAPERRADAVVWRLDLDEPQTRETTSPYPSEALPLGVRVRYELDGQPVDAEELEGASGEAAIRVQLRNPTAEPRPILVGSGGDETLETVDVALPFLAEAVFSVDDSWRSVDADRGRVSAGIDGGSEVRWSASLFEPLGSPTAEIEIRGEVDDATLPSLVVDATPVTADTSDLLAVADDLLTERATVDAVGAFLAALLADAVGGAADGARGIADGLGEIEAALGDAAGEFDAMDPDALADDALAALGDELDPAALLAEAFDPSVFDPSALLDDLDPGELLDELDLATLLEDLDPAALLADADLAAMLEELLAQLDPALDEVEIPADALERMLRDVLDGLDLEATLADLLAGIDLDALLEDVVLDDLDLSDLLAGLDLEERLAEVDLAAILEGLIEDLDPIELDPELLEQVLLDLAGDRTVGELIAETGLDELLAVLLAEADLEIDIAVLLAAALDELDLELPTIEAEKIERLGDKLAGLLELTGQAVAAAAEVVAKVEQAEEDLPGAIEAAPTEELADVAFGLADRIRDAAELLRALDLAGFSDVEQRLDEAVAELDAALDLVDGLDSDEERRAQLADRLSRARAHTDDARSGLADVRAEVEAGLGDAAERLEGIADELDGLGGVLADEDLLAELIGDGVLTPIGDAAREVQRLLGEIESGLAGAVAKVDELAEAVDEEIDLGELLVELLEGRAFDLEPVLSEGIEKLLAEVEDVPLAELIEQIELSELLAGLDLELDPAELLAGLDLDAVLAELDLAELLELAGIGIDDLLAGLDVIDVAELLDELDLPDLAELLDRLGLEPADLLAGLDLTEVLDDIDLAEAIGGLLDEIDFAELADLLDAEDLDLAAVLEAGGIDPAALLDDVAFPDLADLLGEDALDRLLADLVPDPAELLADLDLPGVEALLDELDLDMADLLAELGLDDLGDLDELVEGLLEAIVALAEGSGELAAGLDELGAEGLGQLVSQLDDDAARAQREIAQLKALGDRAIDAQPTGIPTGAEVGARYRFVMEPDPGPPVVTIAIGVLVLGLLAGAGEFARRRFLRS